MAYEIGTAENYTDLLDRLIDFLSNPNRAIDSGNDIDELVAIDDEVQSGEPSQAWTVLELNDDRDSAGDGEMEVYLSGPGTNGVDEIFIYIDTYSSQGDDYYNWRLCGMTGYSVAAGSIANQPGVTQGRLPRMLLYDDFVLPYWFFANGRRFIVVVKVGSVYETCYMGFPLPFGLPTQFPYPLIVAGSACPDGTAINHRYSSTANDHIAWPLGFRENLEYGAIPQSTFDLIGHYQATFKMMIGTNWVTAGNFYITPPTNPYGINGMWPYWSSFYNGDPDALPYNIFTNKVRENIDGSYPLFPIIPIFTTPSNHIAGVLQGAFALPGFGGVTAEDTFVVNGDTYIAFPAYSTPARNHWYAIKKE